MSSEDIDSTTTPINYLNDAGGGDNADDIHLESAASSSITSPPSNQQKRRLSENEADCEEDISNGANSDASKRPRTHDEDEETTESPGAVINGHDNEAASLPAEAATGGEGEEENGSAAVAAAVDGDSTGDQEVDPSSSAGAVMVKQEPPDDTQPVAGSSDGAAASSSSVEVKVKVEPGTGEVKVEKVTVKVEPSEVAVKAEASSSGRESCQYGIKCYRDDSNDHVVNNDDTNDDDTNIVPITTPMLPRQQWTSNNIRKMLKMVEERPVIWQVDFSDRTSRPNAFLEIEAEIGIPALEIKRKLHNMRCTFRTQYRSGQLHNRPVKWRFFDDMKFMYSSAMSCDDDPWDDEIGVKTPRLVPWKKRIRMEKKKHAKQNDTHNDNNNLANVAVITPPPEPSPESNQQSAILLTEEDTTTEPIKTEYVDQTFVAEQPYQQPATYQQPYQPILEIRDDCNLFGEFVADSLRYIPDDLREIAKKQIRNVLCEIATHATNNTLAYNQQNNVMMVVNEPPKITIVPQMPPTPTPPPANVRYEMYADAVLNGSHEIQLGLDQF